MKKLLIVLLCLILMPIAYADDTANIKLRISGAARDNNYFICLPNIGCLSILAANKGKVYPIYHAIDMSNIYVLDIRHNLRLSPQSIPSSCNVSVQPNQTITISANLASGKNGTRLNQLHCSIS
jgi:hypothetical protein